VCVWGQGCAGLSPGRPSSERVRRTPHAYTVEERAQEVRHATKHTPAPKPANPWQLAAGWVDGWVGVSDTHLQPLMSRLCRLSRPRSGARFFRLVNRMITHTHMPHDTRHVTHATRHGPSLHVPLINPW
jgi:hypothetical protein